MAWGLGLPVWEELPLVSPRPELRARLPRVLLELEGNLRPVLRRLAWSSWWLRQQAFASVRLAYPAWAFPEWSWFLTEPSRRE